MSGEAGSVYAAQNKTALICAQLQPARVSIAFTRMQSPGVQQAGAARGCAEVTQRESLLNRAQFSSSHPRPQREKKSRTRNIHC